MSPFIHVTCQHLLFIAFNNNHSNRYELILWFCLTFLWWLVLLCLWPYVGLWKKGLFGSFAHLKIRFLSSFPYGVWFLYMFRMDINPSSNIWFKNIFSHSIDLSFHFLMVFFAVQKGFFFYVFPLPFFPLLQSDANF